MAGYRRLGVAVVTCGHYLFAATANLGCLPGGLNVSRERLRHHLQKVSRLSIQSFDGPVFRDLIWAGRGIQSTGRCFTLEETVRRFIHDTGAGRLHMPKICQVLIITVKKQCCR